jgi:actin-related protein
MLFVHRTMTSTATSLLQEAFESLSFQALIVSISSTLSHVSLILTQCLAMGLPKIKAMISSSRLRCFRSEM